MCQLVKELLILLWEDQYTRLQTVDTGKPVVGGTNITPEGPLIQGVYQTQIILLAILSLQN